MRSSALLAAALACAACNTTDEAPTSEAEPAPVAPAPERIPVGVPHGGFINHVAVTEPGDAAVSLDNIGGLRLWPTLDGSREPVPFSVNGAAAVAISHAGKELLVGVRDEAGAVQLLRFSRTGVLHGRTQVPGEVAVDELVAIDGGMLVLRTDESIERYDENGALRGRIAAEPGESLGALAARHGSAGVILVERHLEPQAPVLELEEEIPDRRKPQRSAMVPRGRAAAMRWIVLADGGLRWGAAIALPDKLDERSLAISPSHERIALISQASELVVLDVTKAPVAVDGPKTSLSAASAIGFVDDDRVVRMTGTTHWWIATHAGKSGKVADPWHVDNGIGDESIGGDGAVADGIVVSGTGPDLVLQDLYDTKYLGWRQLASGALIQAGSHLGVTTTMSSVVWLDRALQRESEVALEDYGFTGRDRTWWLDPNHAVVAGAGDSAALSLVDLRRPIKSVALGSYTYVQRVDYDEAMHQLAVLDDRVVRRFTVDLEHDQITELQALDVTFQPSIVIQLDPARSDGAIAIAWGYDDDGDRMATFREADAKPGKHIKAKKRRVESGSYAGFSPDGTIFMHDGKGVLALRDGKTVRRFPKGELADSLVADKTGERLVGIHGAAVTMYDAAGAKRWTQNVWGAQSALFAADGSIVVRTTGGLIELDPATGTRIAAACGFAFGVMTKTPTISTFNTQPVCEDLGT